MPENWFFINEFLAYENYACVSEIGYKDLRAGALELLENVGEEVILNASKLKYDLISQAFLQKNSAASLVLDKTPRNLLFHSYISKIYEKQKYIYLVRNPLAVAKSMLDTWCNGKWCIDEFDLDLRLGVEAIFEGHEKYSTMKNYYFVKYEDLVCDSNVELTRLSKFVDVEVLISEKIPEIGGRLGDKVGIKKYSSISDKSAKNNQDLCTSYVRYVWAVNFYNSNKSFFEIFGYERPKNQKISLGYIVNTLIDFIQLSKYKIFSRINVNLFLLEKNSRGKLR
ncbi:MAG: hypothetical protein ACJAYN_002147 [Bermanella sp.]|jgi:hypothetical protein